MIQSGTARSQGSVVFASPEASLPLGLDLLLG